MPHHLRSSALLLCTFVASSSEAAIYRVGSGAGCTHATIEAAVDAATHSADEDHEVRLLVTEYPVAGISIERPPGAFALVGGYASCLASAPIPGQRSVLIGNGANPVLRVRDVHTLQLSNLDVHGGRGWEGGGIDIASSSNGFEVDTITLSNTLVRDNHALRGGGLSVVGSVTPEIPINLEVVLDGDSGVVGNTASMDGGGIFCAHARIVAKDASHVGNNTASTGNGGGLFGDNCNVTLGSRGRDGAVLWSNAAPLGKGGGIRLVGQRAGASLHTIDPDVPARVVGNSARSGGAISAEGFGTLTLIDVALERNSAQIAGAAIELSSSGRLQMRNEPHYGPVGTVRCTDAEACNLVRGNRILADDSTSGGAVIDAHSSSNSLVVSFHGTRFDFNEGGTVTRLAGTRTQVMFDGAVLVENTLGGPLIDMDSTSRVLVMASSTIAHNTLGAGAPVVRGFGHCVGVSSGTLLRNSIVWQPGHALIDPFTAISPACFHHLVGSGFGLLPPSAERVEADPMFVDAEHGDYRVTSLSRALDFAPAQAFESTRDHGPRVIDIEDLANAFGPQDVGAYEQASDRVSADGFDCDDC